jgi:hypothetical protein
MNAGVRTALSLVVHVGWWLAFMAAATFGVYVLVILGDHWRAVAGLAVSGSIFAALTFALMRFRGKQDE